MLRAGRVHWGGLHRVIATAYEAVDDESRWQDFLLRLADAVGAGATVFIEHD